MANSARLTNPNDRPQRRSTETFGIAHALCGAVFLYPKRNGRGGSVALRGVSCAVGGEWVVRSAGVRRGCVGERKCSGRACRCAWASGGLRREWVVRSAGNASRSLRACVGAAWVIRSAREGRVAVRGGVSEDLRRGMGGEVGGFNAHSPQQHARTCIIIYTSALSTP